MLFSFFINDLISSVEYVNVLFFADDTKLFLKSSDGGNLKIQSDLNRMIKWCENWQVLLNFEKCKCLYFGKNNLNFQNIFWMKNKRSLFWFKMKNVI